MFGFIKKVLNKNYEYSDIEINELENLLKQDVNGEITNEIYLKKLEEKYHKNRLNSDDFKYLLLISPLLFQYVKNRAPYSSLSIYFSKSEDDCKFRSLDVKIKEDAWGRTFTLERRENNTSSSKIKDEEETFPIIEK